jgi:phosphoribosylglycinamide formyltransferase 1
MMQKRIVVLVSGGGSNLQAIIDASIIETLHADIIGVVANKHCKGIDRAQKHLISTDVLPYMAFDNREDYDQALISIVDLYHPDFIVLAGFMRILTPSFVQYYQGKLINIHPALLPKYKGRHTHKRVLEAKELEHGSTIHFVNEDVDGGALIACTKIAILENDNEKSLERRIKAHEHALYPKVLELLCRERVMLENNNVFYDGKKLTAPLHL